MHLIEFKNIDKYYVMNKKKNDMIEISGADPSIIIPDDISYIRKFINQVSLNIYEKINNQIEKRGGVDNLIDSIIY